MGETKYQSYSGTIVVDYTETLDQAIMATRNGSVGIPLIINLQSRYTFEMTADIDVYSNYSISAFVLERTLIPGQPTSTIKLAYSIPYPYQVLKFDTTVAIRGEMAGKVEGQMLQV